MRSRISFDQDWAFHLGGDIPRPRRVLAKAGTANGWSDLTVEELELAGGKKTNVEIFGSAFQAVKTRPSDDDAVWESVTLPHDWRIKQRPAADHAVAPDYPRNWQGFFPTDVAYYRKKFKVETTDGQRVILHFDGIAGFSDIWLNGFHVESSNTCYSPVRIDVTEMIRPTDGESNVLLVSSDSSEAEGWWYEGGGIYRHTWLEAYGSIHISPDGVVVNTPEMNAESGKVDVEVTLENLSGIDSAVRLQICIKDPNGVQVAEYQEPSSTNVSTFTKTVVSASLLVSNPQMWQIGSGKVYEIAVCLVNEGGATIDRVGSSFGFRTIEWVDDGILVNGQWNKVYGVNIHQDWSVFGVALPERVIKAKLELCAEMGANTIRIAHHAPTPELVEFADRMGMLIIPENRLLSTTASALEQLRGLVRRFRNNPSVLLWSLENEEMDFEGSPSGRAMLARMVREVNKLDRTRRTNVGGVINFEDAYHSIPSVTGMHYRAFFGVLDTAVTYAPGNPKLLDEEGLYASVRGVYEYDRERALPGSFATMRDVMMDTPNPAANAALLPVDFKITGNVASSLVTAFTHPKVSGCCVWAGLDYIGEPIPNRWPATTSSYGAKDLIGIPKDYYWLLRSIFRPEPIVHAYRHWTWPGSEGQRVGIRAYTNCETVEFLVNGKVVAKETVKNHFVDVADGIVYETGELLVRGYRQENIVAEHRQVTSGVAFALHLAVDRKDLTNSGSDLAIVRIAVVDDQGNLIPNADNKIILDVKGPGHLIGSHNGNPSTTIYDAMSEVIAFNGFAGAFVAASVVTGEIVVEATSAGLKSSSVKLTVNNAAGADDLIGWPDEANSKLFGLHTCVA